MALVARDGVGAWRCLCVAPSYDAFAKAAEGCAVPWEDAHVQGGQPDVGRLLGAAEQMLGGSSVTVIAIDMPVSRVAITGRRTADDAISREFGAAGCSTHSPTPERPGAMGAGLTKEFADAGYPVATRDDRPGTTPRLLEVYPHPALLRLMEADRRVEYKVGKTTKYWPDRGVPERLANVLAIHARIRSVLGREIGGVRVPVPTGVQHLSALKRYEDAIDAMICAWIGCRYVDGQADAFGDHEASIWVPQRAGAIDSRPRRRGRLALDVRRIPRSRGVSV